MVGQRTLDPFILVRIQVGQQMNFPYRTDQIAQQVTVRSAVNPSLWACAVISFPLFCLSTQVNDWRSIAFFIIGIIPVISFCFSYFYLLFKNPEYLRSEEYQLRMNSIRLLGDKDNPLRAEAGDIVSMVNNPSLPLPEKQTYE